MPTPSTSTTLQHLLEAEGAVIHAALQARALPSMGGGVGMVLTKKLPPGSTLARFPFRSMITARKARFNLAMAEVALELLDERKRASAVDARQSSSVSVTEEDPFPVIPFTSRVWSEYEFEVQVRSQAVRSAIDAKVEELEVTLDSTETVVCYILLMAALYGRWQTDEANSPTHNTKNDNEQASETVFRSPRTVLRYSHENRWMRTWIRALPAQYDNLLELAPQQIDASTVRDTATAATATMGQSVPLFSISPSSSSVPPLPLKALYTTSSEWLRSYVSLARFRESTLREQHLIGQRYHKCYAALRSLRNMPTGEETIPVNVTERDEQQAEQLQQLRTPSPSSLTQHGERAHISPVARMQNGCVGRPSPCTLGHFLWAFNTLMSRGFFFPEETWALMPFADYFNYALDANGTMFPQEDDPNDTASLSSMSLAMVSSSPMLTATPQKQIRRTGLRSVRVGRGAIPLANFNTYEFQLVHPVRAEDEQVMLHYGAYSDIELLMWYGFTLRPSLLPTTHLSSAVTNMCDETCDVVPLLPPDLAQADGGHMLLHTARVLRVLLSQVVCAATRVAYYRQHIQSPCVPAAQRTSDEVQRDQRAQGDVDKDDYNLWAEALQRAYCLPLSPIADAEGNYLPAVRGQTWLDILFASFAQSPPLTASTSNAFSASHPAASKVDGWMRQWIAQRWPLFAETAFPRVVKGCGFGVFGLSSVLHSAITSSFWAPRRQGGMSTAEQMQLVRGIAWAELYVNATADTAMKREKGPSTATGAPVSAAAATFAQITSVDQWSLLRFLALESSDVALEEYVAYESERG